MPGRRLVVEGHPVRAMVPRLVGLVITRFSGYRILAPVSRPSPTGPATRSRAWADQLSPGGRESQAASTCCSLPPARPNGGVPGAGWTLPPDRSHSKVSRTESPNGRGRSPAAFAEAPDTAQKPAVSGTSGIHSGSSAHGWTLWESRETLVHPHRGGVRAGRLRAAVDQLAHRGVWPVRYQVVDAAGPCLGLVQHERRDIARVDQLQAAGRVAGGDHPAARGDPGEPPWQLAEVVVRADDRPGARDEAGAGPVGLLDRQLAAAFVNRQFPEVGRGPRPGLACCAR